MAAEAWSVRNFGNEGSPWWSATRSFIALRRPIENNSSPGQAVYAPFSGSGTTIIAAEASGRACHAVELSPADVDVALLRWAAFTGGTARLEVSGATCAEVAAARGTAAPQPADGPG